MADKLRKEVILDIEYWLNPVQNMAEIPADKSSADIPDAQARCAQLECLIQQVSGHLTTLVKSMTGSVTALKSAAAPSQQNHLLVLETQITYLQQLAHDLATVTAVFEPTNESE